MSRDAVLCQVQGNRNTKYLITGSKYELIEEKKRFLSLSKCPRQEIAKVKL